MPELQLISIDEVMEENVHLNLEMMVIQLMEMDEIHHDISSKAIFELEEMVSIKILEKNALMVLLLILLKLFEYLFEEMERSILLRSEMMIIMIWEMDVTLLEK